MRDYDRRCCDLYSDYTDMNECDDKSQHVDIRRYVKDSLSDYDVILHSTIKSKVCLINSRLKVLHVITPVKGVRLETCFINIWAAYCLMHIGDFMYPKNRHCNEYLCFIADKFQGLLFISSFTTFMC